MIARSAASLAALALALAAAPAVGQPGAPSQALEQSFDALISSNDQLGWLQQMSSEPNHVGSPHDKANAEFELAMFKQWGWDAHIEQFDVLYPTPISTTLELIAPTRATLGGQEPMVAEDPSSQHMAGALPPYVAYQGDGDVTAPVVYLNYGMPADYDALEQRGISVKGKIVLARYGGGWRGLKPKLAQEHGAVGCLIYSDPADDGYGDGDIYPKGGARPPNGVQRGSVVDMTMYPGRSADARHRRHQECQAPDPRDGAHHPQDPGAPDLLCRRNQDHDRIGRPGRHRQGARRAADRLPLGRHRRGDGASRGQVRLVLEARL